jgi:hypothetical protein
MLLETSILAYFAEVDDPRIEKNPKHPLINVISIAILGSSVAQIIGWI